MTSLLQGRKRKTGLLKGWPAGLEESNQRVDGCLEKGVQVKEETVLGRKRKTGLHGGMEIVFCRKRSDTLR